MANGDYEYFAPPDAPDDQNPTSGTAPAQGGGGAYGPTQSSDWSNWVWGTSQEWNSLFSNLGIIGAALKVIVQWCIDFFRWLIGEFEGVPEAAKTAGTGMALTHARDSLSQFIGAQLAAGAYQGRVLSEGNWPHNFGGRVVALGGALIEFINREPPSNLWKVRDTPQRSVDLYRDPPRQFQIGPVPPPSGAPYSQPVVVGGFFSARIRTQAQYKTQFGFDWPTPQQFLQFVLDHGGINWNHASVSDGELADMRAQFLRAWTDAYQQWLLLNPPIPPGPMPDPCGLPEDPPCPPPVSNQGDQLTDQIGAESTYLYYIARGLTRLAGIAASPQADKCCRNVVIAITQVTRALGAIAFNVEHLPSTSVDLGPLTVAVGQLVTAITSWPDLWQAALFVLANYFKGITDAINNLDSYLNFDPIVEQLKQGNQQEIIPAAVIDQAVKDKIIPAQFAQLFSDKPVGFVMTVLRLVSLAGNPTAIAKLWTGDDADISGGTKKAWDELGLAGAATWKGVTGISSIAAEKGSDELVKLFTAWLKVDDALFSPMVKKLVEAISAQLKPAAGAHVDVGNIHVDPDKPVASAMGAALTAAGAAWMLAYAGVDEGEPLAHIAELVAGAVGFEELRDVQIGPLIRHGIGAVADMNARRTFRQYLPSSSTIASWYARGLIAKPNAAVGMAYNGVGDALIELEETAAYHGMQARQLIRLIETGLFTTDDLTDELTFSGMRPASQHRTLLAAPYLATQSQRATLRSALEAAYEAGLLSDTDLTTGIDSAEHNTDRDSLIRAGAQLKKRIALAKELQASYTTLHEGGITDQPTFRTQLEGLGLQPDKVNSLIAVAEAKLTVIGKRIADAAERKLVSETVAAERKAAIENFKRGTIGIPELATALIATGLTAAQAAAWTDLVVLQKLGAQRWIFGLLKTPADAQLLMQRITALIDQRRRELIDGSQFVKELQALGLPANVQNALLARANATITPKKDAFVTAVGTNG